MEICLASSSPVRICVCFYPHHPVDCVKNMDARTRTYTVHMPLSLAICNLLTTHPLCALPLRCYTPSYSFFIPRDILSSPSFLFLPKLSQLKNNTFQMRHRLHLICYISNLKYCDFSQ